MKPGDKVGKLEIVGVQFRGATRRESTFQVRYPCCGEVKVRSYNSIMRMKKNPSNQCHDCYRRDNPCRGHAYRVGDVLAGVEVLEAIKTSKRHDTTWYRVRYPCCGQFYERNHKCLRRLKAKTSAVCIECSRKEAGKLLGSWERPTAEAFSHGPTWPAMSWNRGKYLHWGDRL